MERKPGKGGPEAGQQKQGRTQEAAGTLRPGATAADHSHGTLTREGMEAVRTRADALRIILGSKRIGLRP